jgi:hypothetical protein
MAGIALKSIRFHAAAAAAVAVALLFSVSSTPALAYVTPGTSPDEANLSNHNTYTNRDGNTVHAPGPLAVGQHAARRDRTLPRRHLQLQPPSRRHVLATWQRRRLALSVHEVHETGRANRPAPTPLAALCRPTRLAKYNAT